ncbi:SCO family protein [Allohahella marinimesophila]|uniref:SCO family protein n=1 Tax=Allohahella marinimesophila TaxID=1054972 RepID=A0ABP7PIM5_9GAMM
MKPQAIAIVVIALLAAALGIFIGMQFSKERSLDVEQLSLLNAVMMPEPRVIEAQPLESTTGKTIDLTTDFEGQWVLVNFGYMSCPDICPINLMELRKVQTQWDEAQPYYPLQVVYLTMDPARDDLDTMRSYLTHFDERFIGARADFEATQRLALQLNTVFEAEEKDADGNYIVSHSDSLALINPDGDLEAVLRGPQNAERILKALNLIIPAQTSLYHLSAALLPCH